MKKHYFVNKSNSNRTRKNISAIKRFTIFMSPAMFIVDFLLLFELRKYFVFRYENLLVYRSLRVCV